MKLNRRSFHRSLVASAALVLAAGAAQSETEHTGMRVGKVFTSTNSVAGNEVLAYGPGPGGVLSLLARYPTQGLGSSIGLGSQGAVQLSGDGRWLFVVNAGNNTVSTFAVRPAGLVLMSVRESGGLNPISVSERAGLVYVLNDGGSGNVAGFRNRHGALVPIAGGVRPLSAAGGTGPAQVSISPDGDTLVVTEKNTNLIVSYPLRYDGRAGAPTATASAGITPFGFAFDRRNRILVSEAAASTLSTYRFNGVTPVTISASVATAQAAACWAAVTPNGRYAYTGNAGTSSISLFSVDRMGRAALLAGSAGSTDNGGAGDIAIPSHGRTLSILAPRTPAIQSFTIGQDGALTPTATALGLPAGVVGLAAN